MLTSKQTNKVNVPIEFPKGIALIEDQPMPIRDMVLLQSTSEIVAGFLSGRGNLSPGEAVDFIGQVHAKLSGLGVETIPAEPDEEPQRPAVNPKKSITDDAIICLEDGKRFKSLKRHLSTAYGLTPEEYRKKWNLPADYPMVAPNYAVQRSNLAKQMGLGKKH